MDPNFQDNLPCCVSVVEPSEDDLDLSVKEIELDMMYSWNVFEEIEKYEEHMFRFKLSDNMLAFCCM